ncbi:hypothetical protein J6590_016377 [Homalodisca vitripennis]|nr:hypothetical protein J6590_016377 [Homalodisca vitripennis]
MKTLSPLGPSKVQSVISEYCWSPFFIADQMEALSPLEASKVRMVTSEYCRNPSQIFSAGRERVEFSLNFKE